jgi:hypothetical protein
MDRGTSTPVSVSLLISARGNDDVHVHLISWMRGAGCLSCQQLHVLEVPIGTWRYHMYYSLFASMYRPPHASMYHRSYGVPMYDLQGGVALLNIVLS